MGYKGGFRLGIDDYLENEAVMLLAYIIGFCRVTTGLVFAWSFAGKVQNIPSFIQTISRFKILPEVLHYPAAVIFLLGELAVLGAMILGGKLLFWGFLLAGFILILFSIALASVLIRKIQTSCNCFGSFQQSISTVDIVRNISLMVFSLGAYSLLIIHGESLRMLGWLEWGLVSILALIFVMILVQLGEIAQIFR